MAHNLQMVDGKASLVLGRGLPAWHKLGTLVEGCLTWEDAMKQANLNHMVVKEALYDKDGRELPTYGIFREDDRQFYGNVGARYEIIQTIDAFQFVDAIIGNDGAHYDSAGALGNGEVVFCSVHLPSAGFEIVPGDEHKSYLLFKTSHDGSLSSTGRLTDVRVVCNNTLNLALKGNGGKNEIRIKHTKNSVERMEQARKILLSGTMAAKTLQEKFQMLSQKRVTRPAMESILTKLFPVDDNGELHTKSKNNISDILSLFDFNDDNQFPAIKGSAYNLVNAITQYADKYRSARGGGDSEEGMSNARAESALFGSGEKFKDVALDVILAASSTMPGMNVAPSTYITVEQPAPVNDQIGGLLDDIIGNSKW